MNHAGIQLLSPSLRGKVFGETKQVSQNGFFDELSKDHLTKHNIYDKRKEDIKSPIDFDVPKLNGKNIGEHFYNIGKNIAEPYLSITKQFATDNLPEKPQTWSAVGGWTRYNVDGTFYKVKYPTEPIAVFDVEVLPKISPYPVMACAVTKKAWYSWTSPSLANFIDGTDSEPVIENHLIPWNNEEKQVIVAHNASYDRARLRPEYNLVESNIAFIDTMSLHVAVGGLSSNQRQKWIKYDKAIANEDEEILDKENLTSKFYNVSSINSLQAVAQLYCKIKINKDERDIFVKGDYSDVKTNFMDLMDYCSSDVAATFEVFKEVLPKYLKKCPHPVSFAGILIMGKTFLPCNERWLKYLYDCEQLYQKLSTEVEDRLVDLAEQALSHEDPTNDPWLGRLDWTTQSLKMTKPKYRKDGTYAKNGEPRPYANQILPGKPEWYKACYDNKEKKLKITIRGRLAPYLLRLKWSGHPIYYSKTHGWTYYAKKEEDDNKAMPLFFPDDINDPDYEPFPKEIENKAKFYKIPHKDGDDNRCGNPLSKSYTSALEKGILSSEYPLAKEALTMNTQCAYWISSRERVNNQFVVWQEGEVNLNIKKRGEGTKDGIILPQMTTMGTVTRRAVEATWMTASNAKKNRIGSELKSMIQAPKGYCLIGADVDSEELWISSLIGDAQFRNHGATAFGWMTLQGSKSDGTDMHSKTASILGIGRGEAKVFNYGRIYGAGVNFAIQLLMQFNPSMDRQTAKERATQLYEATKGGKERTRKFNSKQFWYGGSESYMFNRLEEIATSTDPRTPILNCGIPNALLPKSVGDGYMTSRVNWVVQSSGVDYLHLLLVSMKYLIKKYSINARFMISVHDEIRYLVDEKDAYRAALALQISNLWTRAMFAYRLGINDLPQSVAFFSGVDIDHVLRKEVDLDCVTPSNPIPIPPGKCLTFEDLAENTNNYSFASKDVSDALLLYDDTIYDTTEVDSLKDVNLSKLTNPISFNESDNKYLKAQNCSDIEEIEEIYSNNKSKSTNNMKFHTTKSNSYPNKITKSASHSSLNYGFNSSESKDSNGSLNTTTTYIKHTSELGQLIYNVSKGKCWNRSSNNRFPTFTNHTKSN
ncbi:hypothetical protein K502DRAFT_61279 [Neoconidiobolus thromboides FSU 785]|nr:hypothetical protein K502DRAFT_61279 [Neoconidiobolus thromboides FSU 785]